MVAVGVKNPAGVLEEMRRAGDLGIVAQALVMAGAEGVTEIPVIGRFLRGVGVGAGGPRPGGPPLPAPTPATRR